MSRCDHTDVRYFADEKNAVACMHCGRVFGHLIGERFIAFNPTASDAEAGNKGALEYENERLREVLRILACSVPATWADTHGHYQRSYEAMSDFLRNDQARG